MNHHLFLILVSFILGACQVKQDIASISESASSSEVSNEFVVTTSSNGWKKKNDVIQVTLNSLKKINKVGGATPYISAIVGNNIRKFNYVSGSGTNAIIFTYTVTSADLDSNGIEFLNTVSLNGTSFKLEDDAGNMVTAPNKLNFKPNEILVDGAPPTLTLLNLPEAKNYVTNDSLSLSMVFNENVRIRQGVSFTTVLTSGDKTLNYFSGNGTKTLLFKTELNSLDSDVDGTIEINELDFTAQITDEAGNPYVDLLLDNAVDNLWVNLPTPKITNVYINSANPPASSSYTSGQTIDIGLKFDQNIVLNTLNGSPKLTLNLNSGIVQGNVLSLAPANQLNFRYTIKSGDLDADGITLPQSIELFGGSLKSATNPSINASLVIPTIDTSMVKVSAPQPLSVIFTNAPYPQVYKLGDNLDFTLFYNRPITVSTTTLPKINLVIGSVAKQATYNASLSSSQAAVFRYTVQNTDLDTDGILVTDVITNPTSITDSYNVSSNSTFSPPYTSGITVDAQAPSVISVSVPENGLYKASDTLQFTVTMSEITNVSGNPRIKLTIGTTDDYATYVSGSGTNKLLLKYDIANSLSDSNGIAVDTTLDLNGGSLQDNYANITSTNITLTPPSTSGVLVDSIVPSISSVNLVASTPINFKKGEFIDFKVTFNENVQVRGLPCIRFYVTSSTNYKCAQYSTSLSSATELRFRYLVVDGDNDSDGISIPSTQIFLVGNDFIKDSAGNNATLTFTPPTLTDAKVDAKAPTVASVVLPTIGNYGLNSTLTIKLNWSESISVSVTGSPKLNLKIGGTNYELTYNSASSTANRSDFELTLTANGISSSQLELVPEISLTGGAQIQDTNSNLANINFSVSSISNVIINTIRPAVTSISSNNNGRFKLNDVLTFSVQWNKDIIVSNPGQFNLRIQIGSTLKDAQYKPGLSSSNVSVHQYVIEANDLDVDGVTASQINVAPPIKDEFNNEAVTTFLPKQFPQILVDTIAPTINGIVSPARSYKANDIITFSFSFNEAVKYTGTPYVDILIGSNFRQATLSSGSGTNVLFFTYTVLPTENDSNGIEIVGPVQFGMSGTITDMAGNPLSNPDYTNNTPFTHPISGAQTYCYPFPSVKVDTTPPSINSSVNTDNITRTALDNYFISGDVMELSLSFTESMAVEGNPRLVLDIGGQTKYAYYYAATSTSIKFRYQIDSGDTLLDLNGIELTLVIDLNGGKITDVAGNNVSSYVISYTEKDYVYFSNLQARYNIKSGGYSTTSGKISEWVDITGKGNNLKQNTAAKRPSLSTTGFGANNNGYVDFYSNSFLEIQQDLSFRYAFFALKTPNSISGSQTFGLITNIDDQSEMDPIDNVWVENITYYEVLSMASSTANKALVFNPSAKYKMNLGVFPLYYDTTFFSSTLWSSSQYYLMMIEYDSLTTIIGTQAPGLKSSIIGAYDEGWAALSSFRGQISEIIFANGTLSKTQMDLIRNQLNDIYGIY